MRITPQNRMQRAILFSMIVGFIIILYFIISNSGFITFVNNSDEFRRWILGLGAVGPLTVITLMAIAIVVSPLPSAPIALASGAAYGHFFGAIYVVLGAEIGAIMAFYIARLTGLDIINKWMGGRLGKTLVGSQNTLMVIVFVSRLLPFVSFDVISYAAGLTHISFWRFSLATLAGIIPASFLLAHFGSELVSTDTTSVVIAIVLLGMITLIPILIKLYKRKMNRNS